MKRTLTRKQHKGPPSKRPAPQKSAPQKSAAWYEARERCHLTSSEFGAALGVGRNKSRVALYKQKKGLVSKEVSEYQQQILDYGTNHEDKARMEITDALRVFYDSPCLTFEETGLCEIRWREDYRYGASPDGLLKLPCIPNVDPPVLEIKCPWKKELYQEPFDQGCPLHLDHYCQVQGQMLAMGSMSAYFCCWTTRELSVVQLYRDDAFLDFMMGELDSYCREYLEPSREPPRLKKGRYEEVLSHTDPKKWGQLLFVKKRKESDSVNTEKE